MSIKLQIQNESKKSLNLVNESQTWRVCIKKHITTDQFQICITHLQGNESVDMR